MKILLLALVAFCGTVHADVITVALNFDVTSEYLYTSEAYNPLFVPENITLTATFDDTPTSRAADPHDIETFFGPPAMSSQLTASLPYGPGATTIYPSSGNSEALMTDFDFGSGDTGSYFQIQGTQSSVYGPSQSWTYGYVIAFPASAVIPPLSDPLTFSGTQLVAWLNILESSQTPIMLNEYSYNFNGATGQYLSGIGYVGEGVITEVDSTPEPKSAILIIIGFASLAVLKFRRVR